MSAYDALAAVRHPDTRRALQALQDQNLPALGRLLENVLEHGIEADDQVRVKLSFHWEGSYLRIWVEDSGSALADQTISRLNAQCESEETPAGHALSNIHRRLAIHYGDPVCGLSFSRSPLGGLRVCLTVKQREGA